MSRGWESKSVEEQQAEATASKNQPKLRFTPEQISRKQEKESLLLSRRRIEQQIVSARTSRHRQMLEQALTDLDFKLKQLS